ncbi:histidine kinase [Streptomyces radicis]|uniref:Histidine kinase n=1 Tax=Streptomyces radicis TaxID=1750517 RepID=A0A3A9W5E8_9ACTN|nr:histidine kinase [Streptomyces radicis]RKN21650.1 histidine kinase [Streptomyces radicis]
MSGTSANGSDPRLRRARLGTLASLATAVLTSLTLPGIGPFLESDALWAALGAAGILAFAAAQAGALYAAVTPWLSAAVRRRLMAAFVAASLLSVPLVGPVGDGRWATWAWLGGCLAGTVPLLARGPTGRWITALAALATLAVAAALGALTGDGALVPVLIAASLALTVAGMSGLPLWLWGLLVDARAGREAQARLAATEERLRFARDVHDLLGHSLSVIALKAELAARLSSLDAERAGREASDVQRLAASALAEMREVVHGYRAVDLADQLAAIQRVFHSSGIRCTVLGPTTDLPPSASAQLVPVLREASTNVLRHSAARWCAIEIARRGDGVRMTMANDGAAPAAPDRHSSGLAGLRERLADAGGTLRVGSEGGVFTLEATVGPGAMTPR